MAPPRPARPLSFWALLASAASNTLSSLDEALFQELLVERRYFGQPVFFVSDPEGVRRILVDNFDNYPRYGPIRRLFAADLGTGTLASEGAVWRRHRRVAASILTPRALAPEWPRLIAATETALSELEALAGDRPINLESWVASLMLTLWIQVSVGGDPTVREAYHYFSKLPPKPRLLNFLLKPAWAERLLLRAGRSPAGRHHEALRQLILARRGRAKLPDDLAARLVRARDPDTGAVLPPNEAKDELGSLTAGGAASVRTLTWVWYLLALHPDVESRVAAEIEAVFGDEPLSMEGVARLTYTRQVLDETMRLYPPIPAMLRRAARADRLCGRRVPRGSVMVVAPWVIHRHQRLWDSPDLFDPDRFEAARVRARSRFAYLPFAQGPRTCVAASFAMSEMILVFAAMVRRFRFRLDPEHPIRPLGGISLQPVGGLRVFVEPRPRELAAPDSAAALSQGS